MDPSCRLTQQEMRNTWWTALRVSDYPVSQMTSAPEEEDTAMNVDTKMGEDESELELDDDLSTDGDTGDEHVDGGGNLDTSVNNNITTHESPLPLPPAIKALNPSSPSTVMTEAEAKNNASLLEARADAILARQIKRFCTKPKYIPPPEQRFAIRRAGIDSSSGGVYGDDDMPSCTLTSAQMRHTWVSALVEQAASHRPPSPAGDACQSHQQETDETTPEVQEESEVDQLYDILHQTEKEEDERMKMATSKVHGGIPDYNRRNRQVSSSKMTSPYSDWRAVHKRLRKGSLSSAQARAVWTSSLADDSNNVDAIDVSTWHAETGDTSRSRTTTITARAAAMASGVMPDNMVRAHAVLTSKNLAPPIAAAAAAAAASGVAVPAAPSSRPPPPMYFSPHFEQRSISPAAADVAVDPNTDNPTMGRRIRLHRTGSVDIDVGQGGGSVVSTHAGIMELTTSSPAALSSLSSSSSSPPPPCS